jgi:hypothetical protein
MLRDLNPPAIVRPAEDLAALAAEVNAAHVAVEAAGRQTLEQAKRAGDALLRAKKLTGHGKWLPWLTANVRFSRRTAQAYMRVAGRWDKCATAAHLSDALHLLTEPPPPHDEEERDFVRNRPRSPEVDSILAGLFRLADGFGNVEPGMLDLSREGLHQTLLAMFEFAFGDETSEHANLEQLGELAAVATRLGNQITHDKLRLVAELGRRLTPEKVAELRQDPEWAALLGPSDGLAAQDLDFIGRGCEALACTLPPNAGPAASMWR